MHVFKLGYAVSLTCDRNICKTFYQLADTINSDHNTRTMRLFWILNNIQRYFTVWQTSN